MNFIQSRGILKPFNGEVAVINREEAAGPAEAWVLRRSYYDVEKKNGGSSSIDELDKSKTIDN